MRLPLLAVMIAAAPLAAQRPGTHPAASPALPADTALHTGRLSNGLSYLIRYNSYPAHRLELRLVVRAGSILEDEDQRGLAHFIEHMGFNGTTHFARNDLVKYLESIGVKFGADLNAETSFDQTEYILPVPSDKPELVARAFDILQDWAAGDKFDSSEVASERGVVLGEWRSGLGAGSRIRDKELPVLFQGSRYAVRLPIGDTGIIARATAAPMRRFYHDWYRPDLMAVVAIGDYPLDSLRALIKSRFGSLRNPVHERPRTDAPVPVIPGTRVAIITDPEETTESVELLVRRPTADDRTEADERRDLINSLFSTIASQRMQELSRRPQEPFITAFFGPGGFIRDLQLFELAVTAKEGESAAAFEAALRELRRFDEHGVLPAELDRAKTSLLRAREDAAKEVGKTESDAYVGGTIASYLYGSTVVSATDRYALAQRILPTITLDEVNAAVREMSRGTDRFIAVVAPDKAKPTLPTRDTLIAILARTDTMTLPAWEEHSVTTALVPNPPAPGRIVSDTTYADLGVTDWRLSNGVRVLIKPTDFKADQVQVTGEALGGMSLIADDQLTNAAFATAVMQQSGAGDFDAMSLKRKLTGKIAFAFPEVDETSEGLGLVTAPQDLEAGFQLLWLTGTSPRLDTAAVTAFRNQVRTVLQNRSAQPEAVLGDTIALTLGQNSPRARPMTATRVDSFDAGRALAIYRDWYRDFNGFVFIIVGNVKVDSLRPLVEQWLGGLPSSGAVHAWRDVAPVPPEGEITKVVHKGKEPVSSQIVLFSGAATIDGPADDLAGDAAAEIVQERLLDKLREAMGATYGVDVSTTLERVPRRRYRTIIDFKSAPAQADTLWLAAQQIIATFRSDGPRPDELEKFTEQARRENEVAVKTNEWWMQELADYADPDGPDTGRPLPEFLGWSARLDALTPAMVQAAAQKYFDPARVARFVLLPEQ
ncbi:MAG TPA: insulinase family protein [Gemmatimonadales bacterium]|jgi:zinc protease